MTSPAEEYMEAFLDGYEFMLVAFEGRLEGPLPDDLEAFLDDYHRILELHRGHLEGDGEASDSVALEEFPTSLLPESRN
jgi:hypothetical protein